MVKPEKKPDARTLRPKKPRIKNPKFQVYPNSKYYRLLRRFMDEHGFESESGACYAIIKKRLDKEFPKG